MLRPLSWNLGFAIGHPEIDEQHRHLIVLINEIIAAVERKALDKLPAMLSVLETAASEHFRAENSILRELRAGTHRSIKRRPTTARLAKALADAGLDEHQAQHALLLNRLNGFRTLPPHALCERLKEWFVEHAIQKDARLRLIFQSI